MPLHDLSQSCNANEKAHKIAQAGKMHVVLLSFRSPACSLLRQQQQPKSLLLVVFARWLYSPLSLLKKKRLHPVNFFSRMKSCFEICFRTSTLSFLLNEHVHGQLIHFTNRYQFCMLFHTLKSIDSYKKRPPCLQYIE